MFRAPEPDEHAVAGTGANERRDVRRSRALSRATQDARSRTDADLHDHLARFRADPKAAPSLISAGESPRDENFAADELAAYTAVAGLILNLDEAITKH